MTPLDLLLWALAIVAVAIAAGIVALTIGATIAGIRAANRNKRGPQSLDSTKR